MAFFLFWAGAEASAASAEKLELPPGISLWNEAVSLRAGFGYKDNVVLSSTGPKGSAFEAAGLEVMTFRLPWNNWQFSFFATGNDTRYFDESVGADTEQSAAASAQLLWMMGRGWKNTSTLQYSYLNQVLDVSATYGDSLRQQILGQTITAREALRKDFGPDWAEVSFSGSRSFFQRPLDHYWQGGPQLTLGHSLGQGSEISLSYQIQQLQFDTREQSRLDGTLISGAPLEFILNTFELAWQQYWDTQRHWYSSTRATFQVNRDNGPGYYDYVQYRLAEQLRYRVQTWEMSATVPVSKYDFPNRAVSDTDPSRQSRISLLLGLRGEKKLFKSWKVYASYDHERSLSNLSVETYDANVVAAGVAYAF